MCKIGEHLLGGRKETRCWELEEEAVERTA
jgi:hypothetical protein